MALDIDRAAAVMASALTNPPLNAHAGPELTQLCHAIVSSILNEITGHAVVLPTALVSASPGSPVTGTGSVT